MANQEPGKEKAGEEKLRQRIQLGLDQADRGELLDGEEVFEEMEQRQRGVPPT
jgi:predicted transcriptional regulator